MFGKGVYVGFVHATQLTESFNGGVAILENDAAERQIIAHPGQFRGWQSIVMRQVRFRVEDMSQVDNGVARDGERELGLVGGDSVDADHHECGYIENRRQSRKPRLIGVLRTIVCKHRIGQMTFEQLRRPAFPVAKKGGKFDELVRETKTKLADYPASVKELERFAKEGEWQDTKDSAVAKLKDVKERQVYMKKVGNRWYFENKQKAEESK